MQFTTYNGTFDSITQAITALNSWSWLFTWGMYLFLILGIGILFWVFFDSINKNKDEEAMVPRIMSIVGLFLIIPTFIFRFVGTADGVTRQVRCEGELVQPAYYPSPINWNVGWLTKGYGPMIAALALLGVILCIAALVVYASSVHRSKPATEFVQAFNSKMDSIESRVEEAQRNAAAAASAAANPEPAIPMTAPSIPMPDADFSAPAAAMPSASATIIDRMPAAATIIDIPSSGNLLTVKTGGSSRGRDYELPASDVLIGRDERCFIVLEDGKVSREHIRLTFTDGEWTLVDLGSVNGTYVNGQRVVGQAKLAAGDKIKIGDTHLIFS